MRMSTSKARPVSYQDGNIGSAEVFGSVSLSSEALWSVLSRKIQQIVIKESVCFVNES
jgi:hypothetical protein